MEQVEEEDFGTTIEEGYFSLPTGPKVPPTSDAQVIENRLNGSSTGGRNNGGSTGSSGAEEARPPSTPLRPPQRGKGGATPATPATRFVSSSTVPNLQRSPSGQSLRIEGRKTSASGNVSDSSRSYGLSAVFDRSSSQFGPISDLDEASMVHFEVGPPTAEDKLQQDTLLSPGDYSRDFTRGEKSDNRSNSSRSDLNEASAFKDKKKKKSWYNALYPTYKSRCEDFRKIFSTLPAEERLIVEYSCALQKDILVHGRLYVTRSYLCFYANIFRWETQVALRWKEVMSITKEKTALVIPNAIQICTDTEKLFFTSFASRDKTYLMLFKLWQNALLDQPASSAELWKWVHAIYGDELGFTSEDDVDYVSPFPPSDIDDKSFMRSKDQSINRLQSQSSTLEESTSISPSAPESFLEDSSHLDPAVNYDTSEPPYSHGTRKQIKKVASETNVTTDMSDTSESETGGGGGGKGSSIASATIESWRSNIEGKELANEIFPINVDSLFTLLFTNSKFYVDFHSSRKTFDLVHSPWQQKPDSDDKLREVSFTLSLTHPMGPKHSQVTETQTMRADSKPGQIYIIDCDTVNGGIPYADSFYVSSYFCLSRVNDHESRLTVIGAIKYKKTVWGLVKTFIEKNTWTGLEDYYSNLTRSLRFESEEDRGPRKARGKKGRVMGQRMAPRLSNASTVPMHAAVTLGAGDLDGTELSLHKRHRAIPVHSESPLLGSESFIKVIFALLIGLLLANSLLFYKLWSLEIRLASEDTGGGGFLPNSIGLDPNILMKHPPQTQEEWLKILQRQEAIHQLELEKWHQLLGTATNLLRQTEQSLSDLQRNIQPWSLEKLRGLLYLRDFESQPPDEAERKQHHKQTEQSRVEL